MFVRIKKFFLGKNEYNHFPIKIFFLILNMASMSCNKNSQVFHSKYDPVVEQCMEAYFISSMNLLWR